MNNQGQVVFYTLMVGITMIILALALATPIQEAIENARNQSINNELIGMDCDNSTTSKYTKAGCVITDISLFYWVAGLIFLAGAVIAARKFI